MRFTKMGNLVLALVVAASGGCVAAAAGGLGAGIYYSDRGTESLVAAPIDRVFGAAQQTFQEMGISETKSSSDSAESSVERELKALGMDPKGAFTDEKIAAIGVKFGQCGSNRRNAATIITEKTIKNLGVKVLYFIYMLIY